MRAVGGAGGSRGECSVSAVEFAVWDKCERLAPSAQVCATLVDEYHLSSPQAARLLNHAGYYLRERARYAEAEPYTVGRWR